MNKSLLPFVTILLSVILLHKIFDEPVYYRIDFQTTEYLPDTIKYKKYSLFADDTNVVIVKYQIPYIDELINCYTIKISNSTIPDSINLHGQDSIVINRVWIKPLN